MSAVLIPDVDKDGLRKVLEEAMGESVVMQEYRRAFERVGVLEAEVERLTREAVHAKESLDAAQEQLRQAGICDAYNGRGTRERPMTKQYALDPYPEVDAYLDNPELAPKPAWAIENIGSLEWALERIAHLRAEAGDIDQQADAAIGRINMRRELLLQKVNRGLDFFEGHIREFATANRDALLGGGKGKTRKLIHGSVAFRKRSGRLVVVDNDALKVWLMSQPNEAFYRVKVEPEMKALQDNFDKTGEIPPGMEYVTEQEKVVIEAESPLPPGALEKKP